MKKIFLFLFFMPACAMLVNAQRAQKDSLAMKHPPMYSWQQNRQPNFKRGIAAGRTNNFAFAGRRSFANMPDFTKEQRAQLKTINNNYQKQLLQLQSNDAITLGEYKSKLADLKKERKDKIQNILTDQQKQKQAEAKKKAEINRQVAATARLERLKLTLNLNDEQVAKIKDQQQNLQSQIKSIRENDKIFSEQKRDELKQLAQQHKNDLTSVLTDEQKKIFEQNKQDFNNSNRNVKRTPFLTR
jgi:hypothetical protein